MSAAEDHIDNRTSLQTKRLQNTHTAHDVLLLGQAEKHFQQAILNFFIAKHRSTDSIHCTEVETTSLIKGKENETN